MDSFSWEKSFYSNLFALYLEMLFFFFIIIIIILQVFPGFILQVFAVKSSTKFHFSFSWL